MSRTRINRQQRIEMLRADLKRHEAELAAAQLRKSRTSIQRIGTRIRQTRCRLRKLQQPELTP